MPRTPGRCLPLLLSRTHMAARSVRVLVALASLSLAGCGDDEASSSDIDYSAYEGIYVLGTFSESLGDCGGGTRDIRDQLENEGWLVAATASFFGVDVLRVRTCASPAACRTIAQEVAAGETSGFGAFDRTVGGRSSDAFLVSELTSAGFESMGVCQRGTRRETRVSRFGADIMIEDRDIEVPDYPPDGDGCSVEGAEAAAAAGRCLTLQTLTAGFSERLP